MAMGRRKADRQDPLFVTAESLPRSLGHPFYKALNRLLEEAGFDRWIESRCEQYYHPDRSRGQRSLPPGVYFRMLLVGYFEGIDSQRGIAWRCADSLSLRAFLGTPLDENTPDHSTLSLTRRRLPPEVFDEVFQFVLKLAADRKLLSGKTVGVDAKRGAAPVDVAVQVDQAGRDDAVSRIDDLRCVFGIDRGFGRGDTAIGDGNIALPVKTRGRVDDAAALYQQIKLHRHLPPSSLAVRPADRRRPRLRS